MWLDDLHPIFENLHDCVHAQLLCVHWRLAPLSLSLPTCISHSGRARGPRTALTLGRFGGALALCSVLSAHSGAVRVSKPAANERCSEDTDMDKGTLMR